MSLLLPIIFLINTVQLLGGIIGLVQNGNLISSDGCVTNTACHHWIFPSVIVIPSVPECFTSPLAYGSTVSCGVEFGTGANEGINTQSTLSLDTSEEECYRIYNKGIGAYEVEKYRQAYDTLRAYVEQCYMTTGHFYVGVFSDIGAAAQYMDPAQFHPDNMVAAREWFKKVLYYRDDTSYWCADVVAMLTTTFTYLEGRGYDINASLAVIKFIIDSNRCPMYELFREFDWQKARDEQYTKWRDTVKDSIATPLDTTLPSLEELGLGILRGKPAGVTDEPTFTKQHLASLTATPNPFTDAVALEVELDASTMIRLDVYDELGRLMFGEGQGYKLKGVHELRVNGTGWSRGVYYARISASNGEVLTLKLMKE